jgi:acetylglutamate kinase
LGAIGSEKEINKYIEKFSSPEQRFAVIKVGGSVVENDLENLISSLVFLNQVGLKPVIMHGAGPMLSAALEIRTLIFHSSMVKSNFPRGKRCCS